MQLIIYIYDIFIQRPELEIIPIYMAGPGADTYIYSASARARVRAMQLAARGSEALPR